MPDPLAPLVLHSILSPDTDLDALAWQPFREGVEMILLTGSMSEGSCSALLRYAPGGRVPAHRHGGYEHVFVLRGAQADERGLSVAGTVTINPPGSVHSVSSESGCVALLVWEKPNTFV